MAGGFLPWWGWMLIFAVIMVVANLEYAVQLKRLHGANQEVLPAPRSGTSAEIALSLTNPRWISPKDAFYEFSDKEFILELSRQSTRHQLAWLKQKEVKRELGQLEADHYSKF